MFHPGPGFDSSVPLGHRLRRHKGDKENYTVKKIKKNTVDVFAGSLTCRKR